MNPVHKLGTLIAVVIFLMGYTDLVTAKTRKVSDYFSLCHRNDPDLSECVKRSMDAAKPQIVKGIPELKLPSIDPLRIPAMELREGQGNFLFVLKLKNLAIYGLKDYMIERVQLDLDKKTLVMDLFTPHLSFVADYEMQGKILALPIQGKGESSFEFDGVKTRAISQISSVFRDGKEYHHIDDLKWDINVEGAKSNFTNLFNGEKTLGDTTNRFLNENWKDAFETYKHLPEEAFAQFFIDLENRFFEQFTVDELYPK